VSRPISIVIPSLADRELLRACLAALRVEVLARACADEIVVVDDTGTGELREWLAQEWPAARCVVHAHNRGFAAALHSGVEASNHGLVFALNPDVIVRPGLFEPLVETLQPSDVHAVAPLVLQADEGLGAESLPLLVRERGIARIERTRLEVTPGRPCAQHPGGIPVAFALGGACLFRRQDFLAAPYDPRYEPFYWEDVDWCQTALRAGRRVLVDPRAVVLHHNGGTISARVPERLRRAAIEKNRLLFTWKHRQDSDLRGEHFAELCARLVEHSLCEEREELLWLLLALEQEAALRELGGGP
jgi:GT2 family glycosyltransferase